MEHLSVEIEEFPFVVGTVVFQVVSLGLDDQQELAFTASGHDAGSN
ncbi:hypothetical protein [Geobacter benzoatilyticus]|uniref:Uncharacterized protein n=1 Tax=Geobacter benzoatilyticus TaxID=2815309 RepID=A0ABX7PZF8_9BACT|nr:hypothetical protein [Geobacter benzoatilyticus]QSV44532.1 hypothetical protein JZM60_10150 [Geobacter benzoatilyticus]